MAPFPLCCVAGMASAESVATLSAAAFGLASGADLAVGAAEACPTFKDKSAPVATLLAEHQTAVKQNKRIQRPLVILGTLGATAAAYGNRDKHAAAPLAAAAAVNLVALALSFTLIKKTEAEIDALPAPQNGSPSKKDSKQAANDEKARSLLQKWGKQHTLRTALAAFGFGSALCGVLLLNKKH